MMMTTLIVVTAVAHYSGSHEARTESNRLGQNGQGGLAGLGRLNLWPRLRGRLVQQRVAGARAGAIAGAWCW